MYDCINIDVGIGDSVINGKPRHWSGVIGDDGLYEIDEFVQIVMMK